jgi:hypothetical protein
MRFFKNDLPWRKWPFKDPRWLLDSIRRRVEKLLFQGYLTDHPRIRARLGFEVDRAFGATEGSWLYYDAWPQAWKDRLFTHYLAYVRGEALALPDPIPTSTAAEVLSDSSRIGYASVDVARDVYLAQAAHAIFLDVKSRVPWHLEDWTDYELSFLLASSVCFTAQRFSAGGPLYYVTYVGAGPDATENLLRDPRVAFDFLHAEPEQAQSLVGATPGETARWLTGWFHDYLWHNPAGFDSQNFHKAHPMLADRLVRHDVPPWGPIYVTALGCRSASSLFADLMRSVNVPVRKVLNRIQNFSGTDELHAGLLFDWQGGGPDGRYLLHTDDIYTSSYYFVDPAPAPKDTPRAVALFNQVWLGPTRFGQRFAYQPAGSDAFARATNAQMVKYWELHHWLAVASTVVAAARTMTKDTAIAFLKTDRGFTDAEANDCWNAVDASVLSYGDGDRALGYQRLLDGPSSRHELWCTRTKKCPT